MGQDTYLAGRRAGDGVDAIGGAEAIISHLVTKHLQIPCAHAPALGERILMYLLYVPCMSCARFMRAYAHVPAACALHALVRALRAYLRALICLSACFR